MLSIEEAQARIFARLKPLGSERVSLTQASGRVLAAPLAARHNQPPFDSSAMDGYAVRAAETGPGRSLMQAGTAQAGQRFVGMMLPGQCVRIFTGAPLPIGADAVVIQEDTTANGNHIRFTDGVSPGANIRRTGHDFRRGQELLPSGVALNPAMLALAASANMPDIEVSKRPRIAMLSTGDELVAPGTPLGPDQIVASNAIGLGALLTPYADRMVDLGIVADDRKKLEDALLGAFDYGVDILVTSGGASVGERDYVREVLVDLGVELDFWKLRMRPGKPLMFGVRGRTLIFGLPGNPVSALVTAQVLIKPALKKLLGMTEPLWPRFMVPLAGPLAANGPRRHYRRGKLTVGELGFLEVMPFDETDSSHGSSMALADVLIVQPEDDPGRPSGVMVDVIPLNW